ncbi:MAG: hypothetical protein KJ609_11885 [Gammaproteobacteria bacterium]|nr:hypothetical protein [Gammaproteobacteria bacterium]MBU2023452.1 hypothetical protein [Gammaproteobacteria bacterium]MBU2237394.1 hypothetical protein [Gammaproteobacteria bacterium]MBU2319240.1 hypothetical protein [Gammaproteobacteria bacterium]MBU2412193.1 hypothetical protein [Gammaproteobacteria bacterium]
MARNGGNTDKSHHFAHYTGVESTHCLMTQLHLIAQDHFLNLDSFELPEVSFQYKGIELFHPKVKLAIKEARLESKLGPYFADVLLEFESFVLAIEVCVTHQNEDDKTKFYQQSKIPSIEFDLSSYLKREISEAVSDLKENNVLFVWLYEWCRERLIQEHEETLAKQAEELRLYRARSANNAAVTIEEEKKIRLPELEHEFIYESGEYRFSDFKFVREEENFEFSEIQSIEENEQFIHLKGFYCGRAVSLILLLSDRISGLVDDLEETIVIRLAPSSLNELSIWRWYKHPLLDRKIEEMQKKYEEECQTHISKVPATRNAEREAYGLSKQFVSKSDELFKKGYGKWKRWLVDAGIQYRKNDKGNPKIPPNFKYARVYPCLWVFNVWPIFVLSVLAEIIDEKPVGKVIPYKELFAELSGLFSLHPRFLDLEKSIAPLMVIPDFRYLLLREEIIKDALRPFELNNAISLRESGVMRRRYLLDCFNAK